MKRIIIWLLFILLLAMSISAGDQFSPRELNEILESGVLRVGLRKSPTVYMDHFEDGIPRGYVWDLIAAWAAENNVTPDPVFIGQMSEFWQQGGEIPKNLVSDPSIQYTPDIYKQIDVAVDIFHITPWRERLVDMHPYLGITQILVARKNSGIRTPEDLIGKSVYIVRQQAEYSVLLSFLSDHQIPSIEFPILNVFYEEERKTFIFENPNHHIKEDAFNLLYPSSNAVFDKLKPIPFYQWLFDDHVDTLVNNSLTFFIYNMENSSMRRYLTPVMGIGDDIMMIGMASPKECPELGKSLNDFLERAQTNGLNDRLLKKYAGISLVEYNELLGQ